MYSYPILNLQYDNKIIECSIKAHIVILTTLIIYLCDSQSKV